MAPSTRDPYHCLPLTPALFHVLLSLTDAEVTRAVAFMANSAGANFKEPAAAPAAKKSGK